MVHAWYMKDISDEEDQRLAHTIQPVQNVSLSQLSQIGVKYWQIDVDSYNENFDSLKKEHGYTYEDKIEIHPSTLPDYHNKIKSFFKEHLHSDDEIRLILNGSGYFDVRDQNDKWIRIKVEKKDLLTLPAGIYHRFTLDSNDYIKALRLFIGEPVWTPINRPVGDLDIRKQYLKSIGVET